VLDELKVLTKRETQKLVGLADHFYRRQRESESEAEKRAVGDHSPTFLEAEAVADVQLIPRGSTSRAGRCRRSRCGGLRRLRLHRLQVDITSTAMSPSN
jgi:hypothetical protein